MKSLANLHLRAAVLYALAAMVMGLVMAASHNHSLSVAHGHLNLLGWVSVALYGLFLRGRTEAATLLAKIHFALAHIGVVALSVGLSILYVGDAAVGEPIAAVASIVAIVAMALFAVMVFRMTGEKSAAAEPRAVPQGAPNA